MALEKYRSKRNFRQTPEPEGRLEEGASAGLRFVVQKHAASHLHYDLRLELDGVLKSWAVPKGPSLDPQKRRLAMMTEDHPLEYVHFEGTIPRGSYGAGDMIIWDEGFYRVPGVEGRGENERRLKQGLERGSLKLYFEGHKLKGEFSLVKTGQEENSWLLIKKKDEHASQEDILSQDRSVRSGRKIRGVRTGGKSGAGKNEAPRHPRPAERGTGGEEGQGPGESFLTGLLTGGAIQAVMPQEVNPMLATLAEAPFDDPDWLFELKWDGFRAVAETHREGKARLYSRTNEDYAKEFGVLVRELRRINFESVMDGEIVVVDDRGRADFNLLQRYRRTGQGTLVFFVFDLIFLEGYDLTRMPLSRRKEILRRALPSLPRVKFSDHVTGTGVAFFKLALENGLEGVIAKHAGSHYRPGVRGLEWLKVKALHRQDAVIGGFTAPRGTRSHLGALLLGVYEGGDLLYIGHAGGGLDEAALQEMSARLEPLKRKSSPFKLRPKTNTPATWVEPRLVCEVRFSGWTEDGRMRQPVVLGLRSDKEPGQVHREQPIPVKKAVERKFMARKKEEKSIQSINGKPVELTNLSKVFWPEQAITKGDLIDYYRAISGTILPYLVDRPQSLHRFPNGIQGKHFFQKDVDHAPEWARTARLESEASPEGMVDYLICQDEATLAYMANLGCIEVNPWNSRLQSLDNPDYVVIDLDPDERSFAEVIQVALEVHAVLDSIRATNLVKTSGKTGLHIYVPLAAQYTYEQARQFAHLIAGLVHQRLPAMTSLERHPGQRRGMIYLDYLQNSKGQTLAAPYSVRPRPGAPVATPLEWDELQPDLSPLDFHMRNIRERLAEKGDLFKGVLGPGIDMAAGLKQLEANLESDRTG